jgi:predicted acyl esterase
MSEGDERPWYQIHDEVIRWMDYWLKGLDTGIMGEPPIRVYVGGINEWHYEYEWPLARTSWTKLYLRARGRLMAGPPVFNEGPDAFVQQPLDETSEIKSLAYTSEPFREDTEVTGPLALYLHASIDQPDTNWQVKVYDIDGYGRRRLLTESWLKASHRPLDEARSQPWRPRHDHTKNVPLEPGRVYEYAIGITPVANVFLAGHSVAIELASMDDMPGGLHLCSSRTTLHKVYHDPAHASYLYLPVIPGKQRAATRA